MPIMKTVGKLCLLISIIFSFWAGLNSFYYLWVLPIIAFQTLSYYLFRFKNLKFKKIDKRNNPFIKELPHHLMVQSLIVCISFSIGLALDIFFEHKAYTSFLGHINQLVDAINLMIDTLKQAIIELFDAILQSRFS